MPRLALLALFFLSTSCAGSKHTPAQLAGDEPKLVVMTYNVNYGVAGDAETIAAIRDSGADLVLLQETTPLWERYLGELRDVYPHIAFHHCCGAGGLAYLSKFPVTNAAVIEPPERGWFPAWKTVVKTPLGDIQTLNVHLRPPFDDNGSVVKGYFSTPDIRRAEIEKYVDLLDQQLPIIVAGDFNERSGKAMGVLETRGLESALPKFKPGAKTWRWKLPIGSASAQLDHITHDHRLTPIAAETRDIGNSDHRPVLATFVRAAPEHHRL